MSHTSVTAAMLLIAAATLIAGEPTRKPEEYPVHARLGHFIIAAENQGPSIPGPGGGMYIQDYIAVEVAIFPATDAKNAEIKLAAFGLRINGAKGLLRPDAPGFVAAALKYPNWSDERQLVGSVGRGNGDIIIGRREPVERFPGDRRPYEQRRPPVNPVPRVDSPVRSKKEPVSVDEYVRQAALPEGEAVLPVSGCLFFEYKGKTKKIKTVEIVYAGPMGETSLKLR